MKHRVILASTLAVLVSSSSAVAAIPQEMRPYMEPVNAVIAVVTQPSQPIASAYARFSAFADPAQVTHDPDNAYVTVLGRLSGLGSRSDLHQNVLINGI
jgi:hypothetical protein